MINPSETEFTITVEYIELPPIDNTVVPPSVSELQIFKKL